MRQIFEVLILFVKWKKLMENQIGRKIKVLQFNHFGKYKDRLLQFGQNNDMKMHFIIWKDGVAKNTNRALLEKLQCLLSNASLDKSFYAEALVYTTHLMIR